MYCPTLPPPGAVGAKYGALSPPIWDNYCHFRIFKVYSIRYMCRAINVSVFPLLLEHIIIITASFVSLLNEFVFYLLF